MRLIAVAQKNISEQRGFAANIFLLLKEMATVQSMQILETSEFSSIKKKSLPENFLLIFFHENKKRFSLHWLYKVQFPSLAKRVNADITFSFDGCCSKTLKVPQLLIYSNISIFENNKRKNSTTENYIRNKALFSFEKAAAVLIYSGYLKKYLEEKFDLQNEKLKIIYPSASFFFKPAVWEIREAIKEKHAGGKEYFLADCNNDENIFIFILKAFSVFKKWQQSNMKLILPDIDGSKKNIFSKKLSSYKYKNDVQLVSIESKDEFANLLSASYAMLHYPANEGDIIMPANAMQCRVPVISTAKKSLDEICGDAALYAEEHTPQSFGGQMINLYKDEKLRNKMIESAVKQSVNFDIEKNAALLLKIISSVKHS